MSAKINEAEGGAVNAAEAPKANPPKKEAKANTTSKATTETPEGKEAKEEKKKEPRKTFREKFDESTTEEERVQLAKKVVELRLDPEVESRARSWKSIREDDDVILKSDEFHKIIRPSKYYRDAVLSRLDQLINDGWIYNGSLHTLCGIDIPQEYVDRMEANKNSAKMKAKQEAEEKKAKEAKAKEEAKKKEEAAKGDAKTSGEGSQPAAGK